MGRIDTTLLACLTLAVLASCQQSSPPATRPSVREVAALLPDGTTIEEIAYADLDSDGREEVLAAATVRTPHRRELTALVAARGAEGRLSRSLQHRLAGDGWLPIQIQRPGAVPLAAAFASNAGSGGYLDYIVVQYYAGAVQTMSIQGGIFSGRIRFVAEGLLESSGDVDRLYRWRESDWIREELPRQYLPVLPANTVVIPYLVDESRGPRRLDSRPIHARVGERIFLRRMNTGKPSRIMYSPGQMLSIGADGAFTLLEPGTAEVSIENPAYSDRPLTISIRVDR